MSEARDDWREIGLLLAEVGYTTAAVRKLMGVDASTEDVLSRTGRYSLFYLDYLSEIDSQVAIFACLFMFSGRVTMARMRLLDQNLLDLLGRLMLIAPAPEDPTLVRGTCSIIELRGCYFLCDHLFENLAHDFKVVRREHSCMPPHSSSLQLLGALRKGASTSSFLDVGCGSGCQSIIFGSDYEVVAGFDPSERCVAFAQINAIVNGSSVGYSVDRWETFQPASLYEHIAFNAPDASSAFSFMNFGLDRLLASSGHAQVNLVCEISQEQGSLAGALENRIFDRSKWLIAAQEHTDSPFTLRRADITAGILPAGSLLMRHPSEQASFFSDLAARQIDEIVHVTLTLQKALA